MTSGSPASTRIVMGVFAHVGWQMGAEGPPCLLCFPLRCGLAGTAWHVAVRC